MGWSGGGEIAEALVKRIKKELPGQERATLRGRIYKTLVQVFEDHDCDTLYEARGIDDAFDALLEPLADED